MSSKIKSKQAVSIKWQILRLNLLYELMNSYFLATQCFFICLGAEESHNYGTDYVCSCTYKYEGHADNCRGLWITVTAWEILLLFVCIWNCSHYPSNNCLDSQLCPTNNTACATNCSKASPGKEVAKLHSLTVPPYRLGGLSGHGVGAASGGSLWRSTDSSPPQQGTYDIMLTLPTVSHKKPVRERHILAEENASPPVMNLE